MKCLGFRCLCTLLFTYSKAKLSRSLACVKKKSNFLWTEMVLTLNLMHWLLILQLFFSLSWIFHKVYKTMSYFRLQFQTWSLSTRTHNDSLFLSRWLRWSNVVGVVCIVWFFLKIVFDASDERSVAPSVFINIYFFRTNGSFRLFPLRRSSQSCSQSISIVLVNLLSALYDICLFGDKNGFLLANLHIYRRSNGYYAVGVRYVRFPFCRS